jgi:Flp pilus assembly protein TadD
VLLTGAAIMSAAMPASAQGSYSPYDESAASALARYVRALTANGKDFQSLIGAGRAALELGDTQAAAGFFARADEVSPASPLPQLGMGAVSVANGDAAAAMPYFTRAKQLGATPAMLGCDRGLAYDLLGQQALAQADYRAALNGPDADEARRRMALSLAIGGDKSGALAAVTPLSVKGDSSSPRVRAFVLALTGDTAAAMRAIDSAIPGSWASVAPFLQRLPALGAGQKAAAVNLGIFPDANGTALANARSTMPATEALQRPSTMAVSQTVNSDRLAGIDALLQAQAPAAPSAYQPAPVQTSYSAPVQISYNLPAPQPAAATPPKIWLQLATGNPDVLSRRFAQLKSSNRDLLDGIPGYVAQGPQGAKLVVGPFRGTSDAANLAADLETVGVNASRWTNSSSDRIVPLATQ